MDDEFLRVKIDLPSFQVELSTRDPRDALHELRRILEAVHVDDQAAYEELFMHELRAELSDSFLNNEQVMTAVKRLLKQEEDYRITTTDIATTTSIDLENGSRDERVHKLSVRKAVLRLMEDIETTAVRNGIVHIIGNLPKDDKVLIVDHIHKCIPTAQLRAFHSPGGQNAAVECIFFGDFPDGEE